MKTFIVRFNVEFSHKVEAESEQEAIDKMLKIDREDWDQRSISQYEAEEEATDGL